MQIFKRSITLGAMNSRKTNFFTRGGSVYDLWIDGTLPPGFQEETLFYLPKSSFMPTFMVNFGGKLPILNKFSEFQPKHLCSGRSTAKGSLFRSIGDITGSMMNN